ncbi:hypothetical protein C922_00463 [Plasmodium inui San Antonio 1]|uniref:Uncharacterized protein n=1 Tax=Plasmodium inui San Antonio 1 TaxID=1237626 RepID=W7AAM4_9APIC|nr:hypothetical protein C922_00463 [Plasmodium inui San Antonio 1]EUD68775.1 hypothetical protein C922_00463 [Plasmodium inui San Antonio 1]
MNPLNDDKLEKISNNELIWRIMDLQNSLITISDHMELLKNKNRILDEENEKLENHIRDIVNDVKTELTQNFDKKRSPHFTYAPVIREEEAGIESCNSLDNERSVQREPCQGEEYATPNSIAPVHTDAASPRRNTPYGASSPIAQTTNAQLRQHTNHATPDENETNIERTIFEKNSNQHVNNMSLQKKEGHNLNLLKEHTKSNIYNLLMETEKLNSIFNIASNVLNTSFFSISKDQDDKRKGSQCVQVGQEVHPRELSKHTQRGGSKICKLERNRMEGISEAKNYMNCSRRDLPQGGVDVKEDVEVNKDVEVKGSAEVKRSAEGEENRDIMDAIEIMLDTEIKEEVDAKEDADIMREVLSVEETPTGSDTKRAEDEIPSQGGPSPDDKIATPMHSHQIEENLNGEKDKDDEDDQANQRTPDERDTIKRESSNALHSDKND